MSKRTIESYFADWESYAFGFGYGSGEQYTLAALKAFLEHCVGEPNFHYDSEELEAALGATVAWLMINALCKVDIIEYGTSPRHGWLTEAGRNLQRFVKERSLETLLAATEVPEDEAMSCTPSYCNCGPNGYQSGRICENPFFPRR